MLIRYDGPTETVVVGGFGPHARGTVRAYPDDVGRELLATANRQRFVEVAPDPDDEVPKPKRARAQKA